MEAFFQKFRKQIIGNNQTIPTPYHERIKILYADWTASGRLYRAIEDKLREDIFPLVANTHTDTNHTGMAMTYAYHKAQQIIKDHVGAGPKDVLISSGSGMTGVINKFQRILGLKLHESFRDKINLKQAERPIIFVTHMEHHSNQTSWYETIGDVVVVPPDSEGLVDLKTFKEMVQNEDSNRLKIAAVTSCSNVTGIFTPYMDIAEIMHRENGLCFVDFAASAPYIHIDMHEDDAKGRYLDAIYFSPHKFLGGPGSSGILIFNSNLYHNEVPDHPGGGTVDWTNPWGGHKFVDDIEAREDGGTPGFLQTIRTAMCCRLKDEMGTKNIEKREKEIIETIWARLSGIPNLHILAGQHTHRLGIISFYIDGLHYNVGVKMLNDRFGIQTRGGCSCAGTYGHYLLNVDQEYSNRITSQISSGDSSLKPGWIRMSIHPTHTDEDIAYLCDAIEELAENYSEWIDDYDIDLSIGSIKPKNEASGNRMREAIDRCLLGEPAMIT